MATGGSRGSAHRPAFDVEVGLGAGGVRGHIRVDLEFPGDEQFLSGTFANYGPVNPDRLIPALGVALENMRRTLEATPPDPTPLAAQEQRTRERQAQAQAEEAAAHVAEAQAARYRAEAEAIVARRTLDAAQAAGGQGGE